MLGKIRLLLAVVLCAFARHGGAADGAGTSGDTPAKSLSGDERQTRQKDWEKRHDSQKKPAPEEREAKRKELKARLEKRLSELHNKSTNGTLTAEEKREMIRREQILKRFEQNAAAEKAGKPEEKRSPAEKK